jgi:hypothetical protein
MLPLLSVAGEGQPAVVLVTTPVKLNEAIDLATPEKVNVSAPVAAVKWHPVAGNGVPLQVNMSGPVLRPPSPTMFGSDPEKDL